MFAALIIQKQAPTKSYADTQQPVAWRAVIILSIVLSAFYLHFRKWRRPKPQPLSGLFLQKTPHSQPSRVLSISENTVVPGIFWPNLRYIDAGHI
jgi:hypothetical protein